ncbi:MAG: PKD domain-containing protein [Cytophagales bacterium]|nr:PKD domain-containing protein [Cytophagales bacterium]
MSTQISLAQNITETNWYFGNSSQNLVFDLNGRDVNLLNNQETPFGMGGSAVITDQFTGNLLFYSDGQQIFDGSHTLLTGALRGNHMINVPVVTAPVSGSPGQYYFFTNSGNSGIDAIEYATVDATQMGNGTVFPTGDVVDTMQPTALVSPSEGMIIVEAGDGVTFWLISQNRTNFEYQVTLLDNGGVGATTAYDFTGSEPGVEAAHFGFNSDSLWLAVSPKTANRNVRILDFDPATGILAFRESILNTGFDDGQGESVYDAEWSNDGSKLYISRFGSAAQDGDLYQYDFNDSSGNLNSILPSSIFRSYGLQSALDGNIYHLHQLTSGSAFTLGRINEPDSIFSLVQYEATIFTDNFISQQFPSFTAGYQFIFNTLDFTYLDSCQNDNTKFFPDVDPVPHQYSWDFGDGGGSNGVAPIYAYQTPGTYSVNLTVTINGISQSVSKPVTSILNTAMVNLGNDTTICVDEVLQLDAGTALSYLWSTGELTQTINVDTAGTYWVEIIGSESCPAYDEIIVTEYGVSTTVNNQWYFGEFAGIDFTNGASAITDDNVMFSEEGCASISDVNGKLLFYTNGSTVWNKDHLVMMNGDSIGGDSVSTQSAIIIPFTQETTVFYIFTTEDVYGDGTFQTKMAIVDMKKDSARGQVMVKSLAINDISTEKLTATSVTGAGWLMTHEFGSNVFRSNAVDASGVGENIFSPVGEVHDITDEGLASGSMKFSTGSQFMGVTLPRSTGSFVELFDFDNGTGAVTNSRLIDMQENDPVYGLEFSNSNTKLYLTTNSGTSKLIQYDLDSINAPTAEADIQATKFDGYTGGANYGSLQTGPDGTIFMAIDNSSTIGTISSPTGDDAGAGFNEAGFDLLTRTSRLGLPNFGQQQSSSGLSTPSITVQIGCFGQSSRFSGTGRDGSIEEYTWIFGDGWIVDGQDTTHVYAEPGTYNVQLVLSNRCDIDTVLNQQVIISALTETPQIPLDTVICELPITLSAWPVDRAGYTYLWSTGETTRSIQVAQPAIVTAVIFDPVGCQSATAFSFVADGRPILDLGVDAVYCQGDAPPVLDASNPGASYVWTINGVASGNNRTLTVDTSVPGTFEYILAVTDPVTMCIGQDTLGVIVLETPDITIVSNPTTGCGATDGSIDLTFNASGNYTYELTLAGLSTFGPVTIDGSGAEPAIAALDGGNYALTVTNNVTGCVSNNVVIVSDPPTMMAMSSPAAACPGDGLITVTFGGVAPTMVNYIVTDQNGIEITNQTNVSTALLSNFDIPSLDPGDYTLFFEEVGGLGCVEQVNVTIALFAEEPAFTFDQIQEVCDSPGMIFVVDGTGGTTTYTWTTADGNIVGLNVGQAVSIDQAGTYTVTASDDNGILCDRAEDITVILNTSHGVSAEVSGDPCDGELLLNASITGGTGPFSYLWNNGNQTQQFTEQTAGSYNYFVIVRDQSTGCEVTSAAIDITVEELLEASIVATPDCNNNGVIILEVIPTVTSGVTFSWAGPNGELLTTSSTLSVSQEGTYSATATNATGTCSFTADFIATITLITDDDLLLDDNATFCSLDTATPGIDLNPGIFNTYEWRLIPDAAIISTSQILTVTQRGTYEVTLYNGFTCTTDRVSVRDDCSPTIFAPNSFTPNEDGLNDAFAVIPNPMVTSFSIVISNRWGEPVFKGVEQEFQWDGRLEGSLLPPGTYTYVMKFESTIDSSAGIQEQYGAVILIR